MKTLVIIFGLVSLSVLFAGEQKVALERTSPDGTIAKVVVTSKEVKVDLPPDIPRLERVTHFRT